jgi:hypothetical protein
MAVLRRVPLLWRMVAAIAVVLLVTAWVVIQSQTAEAGESPLTEGRPAIASSIEGSHFPASAAVDGKLDTRWSSAFSDPQWLAIDLGGRTSISEVRLHWERAYARAYEIQVSDDAMNWTTVYATQSGVGGVERMVVNAVGRHVRVYGKVRATGYGYSLWEFQIGGTSGDTPTAATTPTSVSASPSGSPHAGHTMPAGGGGYIMADQPVTGVVPSTAQPPRAVHREFQANCAVSHTAPDDPIVFPNQAGASHNHTFMGNTTTNAASTAGSLLAGSTRCTVPGDRSGYWMPTLYNGDRPVLPTGPQVIYYKSGVRDYTSVRPFPPGLRYLVGSPSTTADQFRAAPGWVEGWECGDSYKNVDFPATCPAGTQLNMRYQAPSCWDGRHLDTPDHKSHMAYPANRDGVCPTSHPVAVPMIEFKMAFPVAGDMSKVRLSSGRGFSFHYDFFNAWDQAVLAALVRHCINGGLQCNPRGFDEFHPQLGAALDENFRPR